MLLQEPRDLLFVFLAKHRARGVDQAPAWRDAGRGMGQDLSLECKGFIKVMESPTLGGVSSPRP